MRGEALYIKFKKNIDGIEKEETRYIVDKWQADDKYMGESFITFTAKSPTPIAFSVGDYCDYRGETYTLNYIPSVSQRANVGGSGEAFVYEQVKMDSPREELDRAIMLDVTPTTGDYVAALGTNYTGSAQFQLYCGETTVNGRTLTPVCALAAKMQANLDRAFPDKGWKVLVDTTSTHEEAGQQVLNTHSDEKTLTFDNTTIANALAEVKNTFEIDFAVKGRTIYIGYTFGAITGNDDGNYYYFGYGRGYLSEDNQGKALFELKRTSDSGQKIVTRLRALGSTKNMPYRYYNKKYNLSQSLFPTNLQLPDTFETPEVKAKHNKERKAVYPWIRDVLGDTNDAYIDKNDNCLETVEGLREDCMRWDGTNADLKEIYPSIEEVTYGELRAALCEDQDGNKGSSAFPHYGNDERVDEILAIDTDTNVGDGILTESDSTRQTASDTDVRLSSNESASSLSYKGSAYVSKEVEVMKIASQYAGNYNISNSHLWFRSSYSLGRHQSETITKTCKVAYQIKVYAKDLSTNKESVICTYVSDYKQISNREAKEYEVEIAKLPDVDAEVQKVEKITVTNPSDVRITFALLVKDIDYSYDQWNVNWNLGLSLYENPDTDTEWTPSLIWDLEGSASTFMKNPFHVYVKDMGFDFVAAFGTSDTPKIAMKSGMCVAREFTIGNNPQKVEYTKDGVTYKAWRLTLAKAEDSSLKTYYPSVNAPLAAGDNFVIIGIEMPDVYIQAASMKLLVEATKALADVCDTKHEYEPSVDDIYIQRNYDRCKEQGDVTKSVYWKLGAGMKFPFFGIAEEGKETPDMFSMIIDTLTIREGEGLTPKIAIKLSEDFQQSTLQKLTRTVTSITNGSIFKATSIGNGGGLDESSVRAIVSEFTKRRFLSKLNDDIAAGIITFLQGTNWGNFTSETGATMTVDPTTGQTYMEVDRLKVRLKAFFEQLEVQKVGYVGGKIVVSKGQGVDILDVEEVFDSEGNLSAYRCYFLGEQEGRKIDNLLRVDDQMICKDENISEGSTDGATNKYYWRLVTAVSSDVVKRGNNVCHWVDLSATDCDTDSDIPSVGDTICHLGNRTDVDRQGAEILSVVDANSPSFTIYAGINSYSLVNKEYIDMGVTTETDSEGEKYSKAYCNIYGSTYIGDRERKAGYLRWNDGTKTFEIKGTIDISSPLSSGGTIGDAIDDAANAYKDDFSSFTSNVDKVIGDFQKQIDGAIETWFYDPEPTLGNLPASEWTDNNTKDKHLGDLYYSGEGKAYRFQKNGDSYVWQIITDTDITKALEEAKKANDAANKAQGTADSKMKVFVKQPTNNDEYSVGDMWVNATYSDANVSYHNDILKCKTAKAAGAEFDIAHWEKASKYTDDTKANEALTKVDDLQTDVTELGDSFKTLTDETLPALSDGIITTSEKENIRQALMQVQKECVDVINAYNTLTVDYKSIYDKIAAEVRTNFATAYTNLMGSATLSGGNITYTSGQGGAYGALVDNIDALLNKEEKLTPNEIATINNNIGNFNIKYNDFQNRLIVVRNEIEKTLDIRIADVDKQLGGYAYLKKIVGGKTTIEGGLVLTTMLGTGYEDKDTYQIMSGISGLYESANSVAIWAGGSMVDKFVYYDAESGKFNVPDDVKPANFLVRMDGTGYAAGGNFWWDNDGKIHADPQSFLINEQYVGNVMQLFELHYNVAGNTDFDNVVYVTPTRMFNKLELSDLGLKIGDTAKLYIKNGVLFIEGDLAVTGGITMYASDGVKSGMIDQVYAVLDQSIFSIKNGVITITGEIGSGTVKGISIKGTQYAPGTNGIIALTLDWSKIENKPSTFAPSAHTHTFASVTGKPTTLSGYGITDAKIVNGVITLGTATITPLTAHQNVTLASGTNNGTLKLTVGSRVTDNIAVKGLGSAAFTASSDYAAASHTHDGRYLRWGGSTADTLAMEWGTLTSANGYTILSHASSSDGGDMGFVYKNGQIFFQLDGVIYQNEGQYMCLDTGNYSSYALPLSGGTMTGVIASSFESGTWINGVTNAIIKATYTGYGAILSMPVNGGRVSLSSYPGNVNDNHIYFTYATNEQIAAGNNSVPMVRMSWDAANNTLTAAVFQGALSGNASSATRLLNTMSLWGHSFDGTANVSGDMSGVGQISFSALSGTNGRSLLFQQMADNDFFRIYCGGTGNNGGYAEIATADDGTEPIYVRQYLDVFSSVVRTLTLLDGSGNTSLPGTLTAPNATISSTLKVGAIPVTNSSTGILKIDGNLVVTGGITMYATDGVASGLMEQILVDGTTIKKKADGTLYVDPAYVGGGTVKGATIGGTVVTLDSATGILQFPVYPTLSSLGAAAANHTHAYLPLAGGTLTGTLTTVTPGTNNYNQGIRINRTTTNDWATLLIGKSGTATSGTGTATAGDGAWLIATPASSNSLIFNLNGYSETEGLCLKGHGASDMKWNNNTVLHAGNYFSYALPYIRSASQYDANTIADGWADLAFAPLNVPTSNHGSLLTVTNVGTPYQIFIPDDSSYIYKRYSTLGVSSGAWFKLSAGYADSSGNASSATKLTSSAGSATLPIYFSDGKPVACTMSTENVDGVLRSFARGTYTSANQYFGNGTVVTIDPTGCISANDTIISLGDLANRNTQLLVAYDRDGVYYRRITNSLSYGSWRRLAFTDDNVASATNADMVDGYHASNIMQAGWIELFRTGGYPSTTKWTRIGRFITSASNNVNNDAMIEFFANGDQNYTNFGYGRLMLSSYGTSSSNMMLTSVSDGNIHFYATIDANRYIWLGHNAWWTGSSKYRVLFTGSFVEWYSSSLTTQTTNPNDNYITDNGTFKYNDAMSTASSQSSHAWTWQYNARVSYATSAGNSDTCDFLHVHGGRNNEANKIVRTDGNGFLQVGYINSSNGDEGNNSSPARVWGTNGSDSYMRTYLTSALSVNYAASAGTASYAHYLNSNARIDYGWNGVNYFNASLTTGCTAKANDAPSTAWWHIMRFNHGNPYGYYTDLAIPFNDNSLYWKCVRNGSLAHSSWVKVLDSLNYNEYAPTKTGTGASGTWGISVSGNASTASLLALNTSPASTVGTAVGAWSPVSDKVYVYRQRWTNTAAGSDTADLSIYLDGNLTANMCLDGYYFSLLGFKKGGSSDSYVLLGGGGHKALSDFSMAHTHPYLPLSGGTLTGTLTTVTPGTNNYNQGIRINRTTTNDWASLLIGKSGTATSGTGTATAGDGAWLIATPASSNSLIFNLNGCSETEGLCLKGHGASDMKWNNNTVLHAGNYSSYALPLSGGTMTGNIIYNAIGTSYIGNGATDAANGVGGALNNLVISSWYGVSFTTSCGGQTYTGTNAVSINCRDGHVYANTFNGNLSGSSVSTGLLTSSAATIDNITTKNSIISTVVSGTYLAANQGTAIINSTAAPGFNILAKMASTNGMFTHGAYNTNYAFYWTANTLISAGTNAISKTLLELNEDGNMKANSIYPFINGTPQIGSDNSRFKNLYLKEWVSIGETGSDGVGKTRTGIGTGYIYLSATNPHIAFYRNNATNYTGIISCSDSETVNVSPRLTVNGWGMADDSDGTRLLVNGATRIDGLTRMRGRLLVNPSGKWDRNFSVEDDGKVYIKETFVDQPTEGTIRINGNLIVTGGIAMYSDTSTFASALFLPKSGGTMNGTITTNNVTNSDTAVILPSVNGKGAIGSSGLYYSRIYVKNVNTEGVSCIGDVSCASLVCGSSAKAGTLYVGTSNSATLALSSSDLWITAVGSIRMKSYTYFDKGYSTSSDERLKNIKGDMTLSLTEIAEAPLVEFTYKGDRARIHAGTIAQYWEETHKGLFTSLNTEGYLALEMDNLGVAMGISLAREIVNYESKTDKKIRLMKEKINDLEEANKALDARIKELEERRTA